MDSVVDLQLPVDVDVSVEAETVSEQHAHPWLDLEWDHCEEMKLWTRAGACRDVAGADERYEHVVGDGRQL